MAHKSERIDRTCEPLSSGLTQPRSTFGADAAAGIAISGCEFLSRWCWRPRMPSRPAKNKNTYVNNVLRLAVMLQMALAALAHHLLGVAYGL